MKRIISVVGARPNFMKVAPLHKAFLKYGDKIEHLICHTGQHYDENMSKVFFEDLELPKPNFYLGIGSGSHAEQTGKVMIEFEKILIDQQPDLIIVVGDVNSTVACSLTAKKLHISVAHVEAGLRSFDRLMPEEINRVVTDALSDYLFVTEQSGLKNLEIEHASQGKIFFAGNVMIDSLAHYLNRINVEDILARFNTASKGFGLVTLHRPSNVDFADQFKRLIDFLNSVASDLPLIFPVHPRTRQRLLDMRISLHPNIHLHEPIGYLDFIGLMKEAKLILTDSGGIQEETTFLGVPCITLRTTTERPVTIELGTNVLVGDDLLKAEEVVREILAGKAKIGTIPELWDGKAAERITEILLREFSV